MVIGPETGHRHTRLKLFWREPIAKWTTGLLNRIHMCSKFLIDLKNNIGQQKFIFIYVYILRRTLVISRMGIVLNVLIKCRINPLIQIRQ